MNCKYKGAFVCVSIIVVLCILLVIYNVGKREEYRDGISSSINVVERLLFMTDDEYANETGVFELVETGRINRYELAESFLGKYEDRVNITVVSDVMAALAISDSGPHVGHVGIEVNVPGEAGRLYDIVSRYIKSEEMDDEVTRESKRRVMLIAGMLCDFNNIEPGDALRMKCLLEKKEMDNYGIYRIIKDKCE